MCYTYTMEGYSAIKTENITTCSNMDGHRDGHTEWSKSDTERQIYDIAYMGNLKKRVQINLVTKQK